LGAKMRRNGAPLSRRDEKEAFREYNTSVRVLRS
jgi:hypothetical protein